MIEAAISEARVSLPQPPQPATPFRFPVIAATVPVAASVAIWLITGSPFALLFAALGPLAATGSYIDSRLTARRTKRRENERFSRNIASTRTAIEQHHNRERSELMERTPSAVQLIADVQTDAYRWMFLPSEVVPLHLGMGTVRSNLVVDHLNAESTSDSVITEQYQELIKQAAHLDCAPIAINAGLGVAVFGSRVLTHSVARALIIQLLRALSPSTTWVRVEGDLASERWTECLPHRVLRSTEPALESRPLGYSCVQMGVLGEANSSISIAVVPKQSQAPSGHRIVIQANAAGVAVVNHPDRHQRKDFEPALLGSEQARQWANGAKAIAARDGLTAVTENVPTSIAFADLLQMVQDVAEVESSNPSGPLAAYPAVGASGPQPLDLVSQGPHAIIGGTTGSGKSELLISWVLAIAARWSPREVTFLLIDFKGGSAFSHLDTLPHSVGVITDLDEAAAERAFASLRAELRFREKTLALHGAKDVSQVATLPRLVLVVDEFAAMMADYPQLHALFTDIAARGRSLGMHLILCTQRPGGVVRDTLLANADLRISLRVNNSADSSAVIGSDRAAELSVDHKGRAWVAQGSSSAQLVQFALASADDIDRIASGWSASEPPRRPWCDPLPETLSSEMLHEAIANNNSETAPQEPAIAWGLLDLPDEQRQSVAAWVPQRDGNTLFLGSANSGKSEALATLLNGAHGQGQRWKCTVVNSELPALWDTVAELSRYIAGPGGEVVEQPSRIIIFDDLDAAIARCDDEYRVVLLERLTTILREGPNRRVWVAAAAQRVTAAMHGVVQLVPSVVRLRHSSRQDYLLSGGESAHWDAALPRGAGHWNGVRCQVALSPAPLPPGDAAVVHSLRASTGVVVASTRITATVAAFTAAGWQVRLIDGATGNERSLLIGEGNTSVALIGSVDEWQSRWGVIGALRANAPILFDGANTSDFRQLSRSRELPPPLAAGSGQYWKISDEGSVHRVKLAVPPN